MESPRVWGTLNRSRSAILRRPIDADEHPESPRTIKRAITPREKFWGAKNHRNPRFSDFPDSRPPTNIFRYQDKWYRSSASDAHPVLRLLRIVSMFCGSRELSNMDFPEGGVGRNRRKRQSPNARGREHVLGRLKPMALRFFRSISMRMVGKGPTEWGGGRLGPRPPKIYTDKVSK